MSQGVLDVGDAPGEYVRPSLHDLPEWNGLVAVSTFSGCGGSSLGLKQAGFAVPRAVEFIDVAADTYERNLIGHVIRKDIRDLPAAQLTAGLEGVDLLEGSPPCASFTPSGSRRSGWGHMAKYSETEQRNDDLFWEFVRLVREVQPRAFIAENVPGLLWGEALKEYAFRITCELSDAGYRVAVQTLNAASYGVPQERRRVIFLGFRRDLLVEPSFPQASVPSPFTLQQALDSVNPDDWDHAPFLRASSMEGLATGRTWEWHRLKMAGQFEEAERVKETCVACGAELYMHRQEVRKVPLIRKDGTKLGRTRNVQVPVCENGEDAIAVKAYSSLIVPHPDAPCPTITATGYSPGDASVTHPTECRKFTPGELKAICGFPPDFELLGTRQQRYERMGRAVMPPVYKVLGEHIARLLKGTDKWMSDGQ